MRVGGIINVQLNGSVLRAKGAFSWNLGRPVREAVVGADTVHGYKETPQVSMIEGEVTDDGTLDVVALVSTTGATVTLELANDKVVALYDAWFAGEGSGNTEEGNIAVRFEAIEAEEIEA